jgi:hypothetical protein
MEFSITLDDENIQTDLDVDFFSHSPNPCFPFRPLIRFGADFPAGAVCGAEMLWQGSRAIDRGQQVVCIFFDRGVRLLAIEYISKT